MRVGGRWEGSRRSEEGGVDGVGVDADVDHLGFLVEVGAGGDLLEPFEELVALVGGVVLRETGTVVAEVVGDVVVGEEAVAGDDALVDERGDPLVKVAVLAAVGEQVVLGDGFVDGDMRPPLGLSDACEDAPEVLVGSLLIVAVLAEAELDGLEGVAGLPLVGDRDGDDVERLEVGEVVLLATHGEHLDERCLGTVDAVLGASVALGNPYRLIQVGDDEADIGRDQLEAVVETLERPATVDTEHLVALAGINNHRVLHQVGPEGDMTRGHAYAVQYLLQEKSIEDNIPVVGDEKVGFAGLEIFGPLP